MFDGNKPATDRPVIDTDVNDNALVSNSRIEAIVQEYNHIVETVTRTLFDFYKNREDIKEFIDVVIQGTENTSRSLSIDNKDLTKHVQGKLNTALRNIRISYWRKVLTLDKVESRMTKKKLDEFNVQLQKNALMDFTENNIRTFILNLINSYEDIMMESVLALFDKLTISHAYGEDLHTKNIHYFNGWKTNKAFRINKKVIIPMPYGSFADSYDKNKWKLSWSFDLKWIMGDFDKVCNFFDGKSEHVNLYDAISQAFERGQYSNIESTYFIATCHKKGTMHLTFKDDDILRRFNVTACKGKGWLPQNYGQTTYDDLAPIKRDIVDSFEGKKTYELNVKPDTSLFYKNTFMRIAA